MSLSRFRAGFILPVSLGILAIGCAENRAVNPSVGPVALSPSTPASALLIEARGDSLARGLALALADVGVRTRLRDNLRDSPFPLRALHLGTYLRGVDGRTIAVKAATALGIGLDAFISLSESGPDLELVMPRLLDRTSWDGGAELDVIATQSTFRQRKEAGRVSEGGYDLEGNAKSVRTSRYSARPYIILRPAEFAFPADPERLRAEAPKRAWNTVTTPAEEREVMRQRGRERVAAEKAAGLTSNSGIVFDGSPRMTIPVCDPDVEECFPEDPPPTNVGGGGATLSSEMTKSYCYGISPALNATTDRDNDRIRDTCEEALASRLAPLLNIGNDEWASERQPYWALSRHPDRPDNVQIIYALAYVKDGGYFYLGHAHEGDSEFIILEVKNVSASKWGIIEATLSAHFNDEEFFPGSGYFGSDSYYWDDLDYPQGPFPRIWSALGKHANYRNRAACESGAEMQDSCQGDYIGTQIPAPASRNLGNFYHVPEVSRNISTQLLDCTYWAGPTYIYYKYRTGDECFWDPSTTRFSGWDPAKPDDVTPYRKIFEIFEF